MDGIAKRIHYPGCWDITAYPTVFEALTEQSAIKRVALRNKVNNKSAYKRGDDCEIWCKRKITELGIEHDALYVIESANEAPCLDTVRFFNEKNILVEANLDWSHHFAVLHNNLMHDEHYPEGIAESIYRERIVTPGLITCRPYDVEWDEGDYEVTR